MENSVLFTILANNYRLLKLNSTMIYKLQNGWTVPLGGDYLEYLQNIPETYGGSIQPSVKIEPLPKKFNGSQNAARTYAEGYQKGAKPVTKAIDTAGQKIFNTTKNVAMFVPGPTGAITWLGQMGADTANGEYSKVAKDLGAAVLMGAGLKGVQAGAKAVGRTLAGKGVNIPWLDAYDYSALRNEYFNKKFTSTGNRYYGPNVNKQWKQLLQDRYNRDKDLEQYVIQPEGSGMVIHADSFPTGVKYGKSLTGKTISAEEAPRITKEGMLEPAHTEITSHGPNTRVHYSKDTHPLFWSIEGKPWYETLGKVSGEVGVEETRAFDNTLDALQYIPKKDLHNWKLNTLQIGTYEKPYRYILAKKADLPGMKMDYHQGITSQAVPVDKLSIYEYNPLIRGFARVKHVFPTKSSIDGKMINVTRPFSINNNWFDL